MGITTLWYAVHQVLGRKIMWKHSEITKNFLLRSAGKCGKVVSLGRVRQEFCWSDAPCTGTVQVRFISPWMNHHEQQWVRAKLMTCDDELMDPKTKNQSVFCPTLCNAQTRLTSRPDQHSHRPWRSKWPYLNGYWVYPFRTLLEDSSHHNICPIWETLKQTGQTHLRQPPSRKPCLGKVAPLHKVDCICIHTCVSLQLECLSERLTNCT